MHHLTSCDRSTSCTSTSYNTKRANSSYFNPKCVYNLADHSKEGILIAWKNSYELLKYQSTPHTASTFLLNKGTSAQTIFSVVYGPSRDDNEKARFIEELNWLTQTIDYPWCLAGDFNLVRWLIDRFRDLHNSPLMNLFNDFVNKAALVDLLIKNRAYAWYSKRLSLSFSRLDRVFTTPNWQLNDPIMNLEALEMVIFDHVPLLLTCKNNAPYPS